MLAHGPHHSGFAGETNIIPEGMMTDFGKPYALDDEFKAAARIHQSEFRANVLQVGYNEYGNRLVEPDAKALLNYYDGLNVRKALRDRYPSFSMNRDADMLRSEHIPFNLFAPLCINDVLAKRVIKAAFGIESEAPFRIEFEFAPDSRETHLNDATAFDTFIGFKNRKGQNIGIGIEVKYTEREYSIGEKEKANVEDSQSRYWQVKRQSAVFLDQSDSELVTDAMRQIWRNHLLGLSMCQLNELDDFYSITLFPKGNHHFQKVIPHYQSLLAEAWREKVFGCTYEEYIQAIDGDEEVLKWKQYLLDRYSVDV
jgi:hypothetical protein